MKTITLAACCLWGCLSGVVAQQIITDKNMEEKTLTAYIPESDGISSCSFNETPDHFVRLSNVPGDSLVYAEVCMGDTCATITLTKQDAIRLCLSVAQMLNEQ